MYTTTHNNTNNNENNRDCVLIKNWDYLDHVLQHLIVLRYVKYVVNV